MNNPDGRHSIDKQTFNPARVTSPRLPKALPRPHLIKRLCDNDDKRVLVVIGQAAQGKTTLACLYAEAAGSRTSWINLHPEDSDAVNLFHVILQSLLQVAKGANVDDLFLSTSSSMAPRDSRHIFRDWADALASRIHEPVRVILDGLDRLRPDASGFLLLQVLLEHVGPNLRFLFLSREMPPFDISQLKIRQELHLLDNNELAFSLEETIEFIRKTKKLPLTVPQIKKIHQATEGWIGGLILLCELLIGIPADGRPAYIAEEMPARYRQEVFPYFGNQVFASQPATVQEFLVRTSILDFLDADYLRELLPGENSKTILRDLIQRNLFVQSINDRKRGVVFRYHQLFRDFLQERFRSVIAPEEQHDLHMRVALLFEKQGEPEEAIRYFLAAGEYPRAISLMERIGMDMLRVGRSADVSQWLKKLPEEAIKENPWLLMYLYLANRFTEGKSASDRLHRAHLLFSEQENQRGLLLSTGYLIEAYYYGGFHAIPLETLLANGEALLNSPGIEHYPEEQAHLWLQIGQGLGHGSGRLRDALQPFENARLSALRAKDVSIQIQSLLYAGSTLTTLGEIAQAREKLQKADDLLARHDYPEMKTMSLVYWSFCLVIIGELLKGASLIQEALGMVEHHGFFYLLPIIRSYEMTIKIHLGRHQEAAEIGQAMMKFHESEDNPMPLGITSLFLGMNAYYQGDLQDAAVLVERSGRWLSSQEGMAGGHLYIQKLMSGHIARHQGDYEQAEESYAAVHDWAAQMAQQFILADYGIAMSLLNWHQGRKIVAREHLHKAIRIAVRHNYVFFPLLHPQLDLLPACLLALELEDEDIREYAARLISTRLAPWARPELECLSGHPDKKVQRRALEIRQQLHRSKRPIIRIETFGRFRVYRNGTPIDDDEWGGSTPKQLLKALITRSADGVQRDLLMDDLWPETSARTGNQNFKVTLHRLRRVLEPDADAALGFSYVILKDNALSLDKTLCQMDVEIFLDRRRQGEAAEKTGDTDKALTIYSEANDLYRGDFLGDDPYLPWASERRNFLRQCHTSTFLRMAELNEAKGRLKKSIACYHRIIEADPIHEESYRKLMQLYTRCGMGSAALKIYEHCRKTLRANLDTEPGEVTNAIYRKLLKSA